MVLLDWKIATTPSEPKKSILLKESVKAYTLLFKIATGLAKHFGGNQSAYKEFSKPFREDRWASKCTNS
jgi:hypothetical protein